MRVGRNDYSAHRELMGRFVEVAADLSRVEVRHQGCFVAAHDRVWARGMTTTDPVHVTAANVLRAQHEQPAQPAVDPHDALVRDLADYDRAFGLIDGRADGVIDGEVT